MLVNLINLFITFNHFSYLDFETEASTKSSPRGLDRYLIDRLLIKRSPVRSLLSDLMEIEFIV